MLDSEVAAVLSATLDNNATIRGQAEAQLDLFSTQPEAYLTILYGLAAMPSACIQIKTVLSSHWEELTRHFQDLTLKWLSDTVLNETQSHNSILCQTLARLIDKDEKQAEFINLIVPSLQAGNKNALICLQEWIGIKFQGHDEEDEGIADEFLPALTTQILPVLLQLYPVSDKGQILSVLSEIFDSLEMVEYKDRKGGIVDSWIGVLLANMPDEEEHLFNVLEKLLTIFPKQCQAHLQDILSFTESYIKSLDPEEHKGKEAFYLLPLLLKPTTYPTLDVLVSCCLRAICLDDEKVEEHMADPDSWITSQVEQEELTHGSLDGAAVEAVYALCERYPQTYTSLQAAPNNSWQMCQSIFRTVTSLASLKNPPSIEFLQHMSNYLPEALNEAAPPLLRSTALMFAATYARVVGSVGIDAALKSLSSPHWAEKSSAIKSCQLLCKNIPEEMLPRAKEFLIASFALLSTSSETCLTIIVDTIRLYVQLSPTCLSDEELAQMSKSLLSDVWIPNAKDPLFSSAIHDLFKTLTTSGQFQAISSGCLPILKEAIQRGTQNDADTHAIGAVDLLLALLSGGPPNLVPGFTENILCPLLECLQTANDRELLQSGIQCITLFVRKDCQTVLILRNNQGSLIVSIFGVISRMLVPSQSESAGLKIGELIIQLLRSSEAAPEMASIMPDLLAALLNRLETAESAAFIQSLTIPFAYLICTNLEMSLDFLKLHRCPSGNLGAQVLFNSWCDNSESFQGFWPIRVSTLALTKILEAGSSDISNLTVNGDRIYTERSSHLIMTRSMTKKEPIVYQPIPLKAKILKIALHEVETSGDTARARLLAEAVDAEEDDGDEEWEDDDPLPGQEDDSKETNNYDYLSSLLGPNGSLLHDDVASQDQEDSYSDDPISKMDMTQHLIGVIRRTYGLDEFARLAAFLSAEESQVLKRILSA